MRKDIAIFEKEYEIIYCHFYGVPKWKTPLLFILQFWAILKNLRKIDIFICQFAGYSAFLPALFGKVLGKPCLLVTGGTESAHLPSIDYGDFRKPLLGFFTCISLRLATHHTPVHISLVKSDYTYNPEKYPKQGMECFCNGLKTPYTVIFNGFDDKLFIDKKEKRLPNSFITMAMGIEKDVVFLRKGMDLIFEVATRFPHYTFSLVGLQTYSFHRNPPVNVKIYPATSQSDLVTILNRHEFYCGLSMFEGFPNALCEAMLCGCIPIGSSVAAIPDIIADTGFILQEKNVAKLAELLQIATKCDKATLSQKARQRIVDNFLMERRERELLGLVANLIHTD